MLTQPSNAAARPVNLHQDLFVHLYAGSGECGQEFSALVSAAARGHGKTVEILLRGGADPGIRARDGTSALELARSEGHADVVRNLEGSLAPKT